MRSDTRLQNFFLPLIAGAILALPVVLLTRAPSGSVSSAAPQVAEVEAVCGPFVESFTAMRVEADRIASLALMTATPTEEGRDEAGARAAWNEIAAAARSLDAWLWEANEPNAPLNMREIAVVTGVAPIASELKWDVQDVASRLSASESEDDIARMSRRMDSIARAAAGIARAIDPLTACEAPVVSYGPRNECETRDPEFQVAMAGACGF